MIYAILPVIISILAARGFDFLSAFKDKKQTLLKVTYVAGGVAILSLILLILSDSLIDFNSTRDDRYNPSIKTQLILLRYDLFNKGIILALVLSTSFLILYYYYYKNKILESLFSYGIMAIVILDLGFLNNEFVDVKPKKNMDNMFQKNLIINQLVSDTTHFRIFPADEINSNKYSYWNIESIGGYRPIKLRLYQDLMDAGGFNRPHILDMLNVKYVVTNKKINNPDFIPLKGIKGIYENKKVLPKAWIVGKIKSVKSQEESLMETLLRGFDPSKAAIVLGSDKIDLPLAVEGKAKIKSKKENKIEINCKSKTGGLLVLSEIYYEPGWKAFVDGKETEIYQTNHILRSVQIPPGNSEVIFKYNSLNWEKTRMLSRVSLLIILILLGFSVVKEKRHKKYNDTL